jgi:crossover junction endodeoxyribonuclease RuvC
MILGLDPGINITGYAAIDGARLIECGTIRPTKGRPTDDRLRQLRVELEALIQRLRPTVIGYEEIFVQHLGSVQVMAETRLVVRQAAWSAGLETVRLSPSTVKKAATGRGNATKDEVAEAVCRILGLAEAPKPQDVTDAIAVALAAQARA